ncbi:MAG: acyltransferase [Thiocapsa sp.]|uniref:acyltransferase n=2 Tax=Thiocapsa sp. TaxID=2024551 RepID=UPI001BCD1C3B|nr:MAG: acyltransferase [Thiocapsa sp.]
MVIFRRIRKKLLVGLAKAFAGAQSDLEGSALPRFGNKPTDLTIQLPHRIENPQHIFLGNGVRLGPNCVLNAKESYPGKWMKHPEERHIRQEFNPLIRIGDRVTATSGLQVIALQEITIEDDVMFASNIYISDGMHSYASARTPYKYQGMTKPQPIRIGLGSWIGQNVVIMPGVSIGTCTIVGANSVVTRNLPSRAIAVGAPARVVKLWSDEREEWEIAQK